MNLQRITATALAALMLAAGSASAGEDHDKDHHANLTNFDDSRYNFHLEGANQMIFNNPVSFTGEVIDTSDSHRTLEAANGMTIRVPNQGLVWNGDRQMFAQSTALGDEVVVHMRAEEGYRIMNSPVVNDPWVAVGSYEGVFYFPKDFIADLDLDELDNNIYADSDDYEDEDVAYDDDDVDAVIVTDEDIDDGEATVTEIDYNDDNYDEYNLYDIDLESID